MGAERASAYIPEDVKRSTAVHEGGHALVALYTRGSMPLHKVTCMPRGHALGIVSTCCSQRLEDYQLPCSTIRPNVFLSTTDTRLLGWNTWQILMSPWAAE